MGIIYKSFEVHVPGLDAAFLVEGVVLFNLLKQCIIICNWLPKTPSKMKYFCPKGGYPSKIPLDPPLFFLCN